MSNVLNGMMMKTLAMLGLWLALISQATAADNKVQSALFATAAPDGDGYLMGLELSPPEGWHTYWKNPGDAGLGTNLRWTLPQGAEASETIWPTPKPYLEGELMTYGYGHTHVLFSRLRLDQQVSDADKITLKARWLVCKDICIPESASFELEAGQIREAPTEASLIAEFQQLPEKLIARGRFHSDGKTLTAFVPLPAHWAQQAQDPYWFVGSQRLLSHAASASWSRNEEGVAVQLPLQQDAEIPSMLTGLVRLSIEDQVHALDVTFEPGALPQNLRAWQADTSGHGPSLGVILLMAFVGGLILNLMPCVFPVLTLKAMNLARAESLREKREESLAYTAGVVLSFLSIAGVLLALRAGGAALGWGFQLQNPLVVGLLACLMVLLGLALLGWTQIGMSFMGVGQGLTQQHGVRGAFFTGVLAVVVASPCSAPFMGSALGYAVLQPAPIALGIFASLGLGLAAPFAMLPWTPGLAHKLPRPGPWMETLKHWMALPMLLTAAWLFWVLWRQAGNTALLLSLGAMAALALGIRQKPGQPTRALWQKITTAVGLVLLAGPAWVKAPTSNHQDLEWTAWSLQEIDAAAQRQQMVFVDFTADWCLSCMANERAVISSERVKTLFDANNVLMLKADWTSYDSQITEELARHGRNGVPLYLLYPASGGQPRVLPQILTPSIIENALSELKG